MNTILKSPITDKCAWRGEDIAQQTDWIHQLSIATLKALDDCLVQLAQKQLTAPNFIQSDVSISDAEVLKELAEIAEELENGYGFIVLRGIDAAKYNEVQMSNMYYALGLYLGEPVTQNARGDLIGYVENIGDKKQKMTRVYETNSYLPYHSDMSDVVGLLSIRKAKQGGLSSLVSSASVYNTILEKYPEYLKYVTTSRRTSFDIESLIDEYEFDYKLIYSREPNINPIGDFIDICDEFFITIDSTSMLSEVRANSDAKINIIELESKKENTKYHKLAAIINDMDEKLNFVKLLRKIKI